jgi:hypothetical protein
MELRPPADPCMCGSFSTWHGACYVGLAKSEIEKRHREFVTRYKRVARRWLARRALRGPDPRTAKK